MPKSLIRDSLRAAPGVLLPCAGARPAGSAARRERGFTVIELMIAVAIVAILASVALPSYSAYVQRARVPPALDALTSLHSRLEQRYQDTGAYACPAPPAVSHFTVTCQAAENGQSFTATATGSGTMAGYVYRIDHLGTRTTPAHPRTAPSANCWSIRGQTCDA